jgi:tRNA threonylcarbamoyladenosine biosynthesis protein TsaE
MELIVESLEASARLGKHLGSLSEPGDIICLGGDLGAGKTTLAQSIAAGAGIGPQTYVSSPTFSIMHEYSGKTTIYHMDFYRLGSSEDVLELGLDEYFYGDGVALVEWFERAADIIPASALYVTLTVAGELSRKVEFYSNEHHWQNRMERLLQQLDDGYISF